MLSLTESTIELVLDLDEDPCCEWVLEDDSRCNGVVTHVSRTRCGPRSHMTCSTCAAAVRESQAQGVLCAACRTLTADCWWLVIL